MRSIEVVLVVVGLLTVMLLVIVSRIVADCEARARGTSIAFCATKDLPDAIAAKGDLERTP